MLAVATLEQGRRALRRFVPFFPGCLTARRIGSANPADATQLMFGTVGIILLGIEMPECEDRAMVPPIRAHKLFDDRYGGVRSLLHPLQFGFETDQVPNIWIGRT